jgi:hypothetical protein
MVAGAMADGAIADGAMADGAIADGDIVTEAGVVTVGEEVRQSQQKEFYALWTVSHL